MKTLPIFQEGLQRQKQFSYVQTDFSEYCEEKQEDPPTHTPIKAVYYTMNGQCESPLHLSY